MKMSLLIRRFNLIEITMAIAVVGIGIAGIMALFPPALEANKKADNQNYVGSVSELVMAFVEKQVMKNFASINNFSKTYIQPDARTVDWTSAVSGFPGIYQVTENKVYGVESADKSVNAYIVIWSPDEATPDFPPANTSDLSRRVYVEVSWPAVLPAAKREKRLYFYDVFKPE